MQTKAETPDEYLNQLEADRKQAMTELREILLQNLPQGFTEMISYGSIGYVVSHSLYPAGYHCDKKLPLPFINIASQKNHIALHHLGIYADADLLNWFQTEYPKHSNTKLDIGKGCMRFKNVTQIPYKLIAELARKWTPEKWIEVYETNVKKGKK
jgi:hypothetical protein